MLQIEKCQKHIDWLSQNGQIKLIDRPITETNFTVLANSNNRVELKLDNGYVINIFLAESIPLFKQVCIPNPLMYWHDYWCALHEFGHIFDKDGADLTYLHLLSSEAGAWNWAILNSIMPVDDNVQALIRTCLQSKVKFVKDYCSVFGKIYRDLEPELFRKLAYK